jgi:hypothetical protein
MRCSILRHRRNWLDDDWVMPPRTLSEQWEALRPRLNGFRSWLGTGERRHSLLVLLWPLVALIIAILVVRRASNAKDLADLISALASLTWPVVIIAIVNWFRPEIRAILSRIRKGEFLGTKFELDELQTKTEAAEISATAPPGGDRFFEHTITVGPAPAQDEIEEVLREAGRSPKLGLILLSTKIERAARELAADIGLDVSRRPAQLNAMIRALVQAEQLPEEAGEALNLFDQVRNRIIHGHDADDDEIARAIDSGTRLLRLLLSRPRPQPETKRPEDGG